MESLPSSQKFNINFSITDYTICEDIKFPYSKYFMYTINIQTNKKSWNIKRRYTHFDDLKKKLKIMKISNIPKLPPKKLFLTSDALNDRKLNLQKFLNTLCAREDVFKNNDLLNFIEIEKEEYLMLKENIEDSSHATFGSCSTNENSPIRNDKIRSFINLRKSKSSDVLINDNFFYSKKLFRSGTEQNESEILLESNMKTKIKKFLRDLNTNLKDKCGIIKEFDEQLRNNKSGQSLQREEVYRLMYGEVIDCNLLHGLIYHSGNFGENQIGAECCLEFLSTLIDHQHNIDCDYFVNILKIAKLPSILEMKLDTHINSNKKKVLNACCNILKTLLNEDKGILIMNILKSEEMIEKCQVYLNNMS